MIRENDAFHMNRVEEKLVPLQAISASNGGLDSFSQSSKNQ